MLSYRSYGYKGGDYAQTLMQINEGLGIKSSFHGWYVNKSINAAELTLDFSSGTLNFLLQIPGTVDRSWEVCSMT